MIVAARNNLHVANHTQSLKKKKAASDYPNTKAGFLLAKGIL